MITLTGWVDYGADQPENPLGGLGGWVRPGHVWSDYLDNTVSQAHPYAEALRQAVVAGDLRVCGDCHQHGDAGVPLFSDGTVSNFSFRGWGDLMACIWNSETEGAPYSYMSFYMGCVRCESPRVDARRVSP